MRKRRCTASLVAALMITAPAMGQTSVKEGLNILSEKHGVHFVYDASMELDMPYDGKPIDKMSVKKALKSLLSPYGLLFHKRGNNIIIRQSETYDASETDVDQKLNEVIVSADVNAPMFTTQTGRLLFKGHDINTEFSLLSSPDLIKTLQRSAGVQSGVELSSGMFVHGGCGDDNLFLLDGTPIYQVNHSLGLFSSFNTDIIETADFYKSGFPARYSGRISSVTDIRTTDGDFKKFKWAYSIGLLDGHLHLEGPITKNKTSFNFSIRRSWSELLTTPLCALASSDEDEEYKMKYYFYDMNVKITHKINDRNKIWASVYVGKDKLHVIDDFTHDSNIDISDTKIGWGNVNTTIGADVMLTEKLNLNASLMNVHSTSYHTFYEENGWKQTQDSYLYYNYDSRSNKTKVMDWGAKADLLWRPVPKHHVRFGGSIMLHSFKPQTSQFSFTHMSESTNDTITLSQDYKTDSQEMTLDCEDEFALNERMMLNAGTSITAMKVKGCTYVIPDPRIAFKWQTSENVSTKLSYTHMSQGMHRISSTLLDMPSDFWVPTTAKLRPTHAHQLAAGVYYSPKAGWILTAECYYKYMTHLLQYSRWVGIQPMAYMWDKYITEGDGRAYGVDMSARYKNNRLEASAAYTLSWSQRNFSEIYDGWFNDQFDNRHKLNLMLRYKFNKKTSVYAAWVCRNGNRVSLPIGYAVNPSLPEVGMSINSDLIYDKPNNVSLPMYHRLDVGFNFHHVTKHGHERIWNLSLYNAYCHRNTMYLEVNQKMVEESCKKVVNGEEIYYTYSYASPKCEIRAKGFIPIIPSVSYTIKY